MTSARAVVDDDYVVIITCTCRVHMMLHVHRGCMSAVTYVRT